MAQNHEPNAALGRYIEMLHRRVKVDGKLLTIREICDRASMSARTYEKVKKGQYESEPVLRHFPHLSSAVPPVLRSLPATADPTA